MATQEAEEKIDVLANNMPELGEKMQVFSLSMRSLYADNSVSSSVPNGLEFIKLRDETRNDAVAYLKGVMPLNETCVMKLQEFFEYYECLSFEEWEESVKDILEEVTAYQEACTALVTIHEDMMTGLKEREDKANVLCKKFGNLEEEYEKKIAALRETADAKLSWALQLALVPLIGAIAFPLVVGSAKKDIAQSVAEKGQQRIMLAAAKAVSDVLIPALKNFIQGLEIISGFFEIMQKELKSFDRMADKKKLHYKVLKAKSSEIKMGCRAFHGILPSVRSDFQAIPTEGTDFNYVDEWLEKQKKVIEKHCLKEISREFLRNALKAVGISENALEAPENSAA